MQDLAHPAPATASEPKTQRRERCGGKSNGLTIAAIVVGFLVWWPLGLAAVAWAIWRDQISAAWTSRDTSSTGLTNRLGVANIIRQRPSNSALAAYLTREQERLRAEQAKLDELISAFDAFKEAESRSADQRDFDSFMRQHDAEKDSHEAFNPKPAN